MPFHKKRKKRHTERLSKLFMVPQLVMAEAGWLQRPYSYMYFDIFCTTFHSFLIFKENKKY